MVCSLPFPRRYALGLLSLLLTSLAGADLLVQDDFSQTESNPAAGWAAPWKFSGALNVETAEKAMAGQGWAMRPMLQSIDFDRDGEYFFRVTIERTGLGTQGNSYAALQLYNNDKAVDNRPLRMGIDSGDVYMFGLGTNERLNQKTKADQPYTLVAPRVDPR